MRDRRCWCHPWGFRAATSVLALPLAIALAAAACGPPSRGRGPAAEGAATKSSHDRMIAVLRHVADRTDDENEWLGERPAREIRKRLAALPGDTAPLERVNLLVDVASQELRLGNEAAAVARLEEAKELALRTVPPLPTDTAAEVLYRLGIAWLRLGETDNCCNAPTAQSCIVPIEGAGRHGAQRGSRNAMENLRAVLALPGAGAMHRLKSRWLLNLAAMTLGEWPHGLTAEERIPQSAFDSGARIPRFENVAKRLGVDTFHLAGGAIVDDLDGDGRLDILTSTSDTRASLRFLRNDGRGGFEDRTKAANVEGELGGLNMVAADYDNDGDLDVYVLRGGWFGSFGHTVNSLLSNDGAGRFTDVTFDAGLGARAFPTQTAAFGDYDGDGDLDLCVGSETSDRCTLPNQLFRNEGDGTFTDVAREAGVENFRYAKAVVWGDYDGDRRPDLYVSNMGSPNRLYRNEGGGRFTDVAPQLGVDGPVASFPAWFFDFDNDGALDLFVPSYRGLTDEVGRVAASALGETVEGVEVPRLYQGDGRGAFRDVAAERGLTRLVAPMGSNFGDLNLDGWPDIYLGTGYPDYEGLMPNVMYLNDGGRSFVDVTWAGGFGHLQKGHAVAFADIDADGDMDVFEQMGGALPGDRAYDALYRNPGWGGHWLTVLFVGTRSNRSAIGARIRADIVEDGKRRSVYRHVNTGGSFGCNPLRQTIGLGKATRVERLEVFWPTTGETQVFEALEVDRRIRIVEGRPEVQALQVSGGR